MKTHPINRKNLVSVAKQEIQEWKDLPQGLVMAILFAFIHRVTEGETVEEMLERINHKTPPADYQI